MPSDDSVERLKTLLVDLLLLCRRAAQKIREEPFLLGRERSLESPAKSRDSKIIRKLRSRCNEFESSVFIQPSSCTICVGQQQGS